MNELQKYIKDEILALFRLILESEYGINEKIGRNTLGDSNLAKEAKVESNTPNEYLLFYNDYLEYIESGRKPFARKVPVQALIQWARRKGINDDSSTIYAIRESIYKYGIKARPLLIHFERELDVLFDKDIFDKLFDNLTKILDNYFN